MAPPRFPIDTWLSDMNRAIDRIVTLGSDILDRHRSASPKAAESVDRWHLADRLGEEKQMLLSLTDLVRQIIEAIEICGEVLHDRTSETSHVRLELDRCSETIERCLPSIETAFLNVRRAAQDLLQWTERSGKVEGSELPLKYRDSYADLIAYAPVFRPMVKTFQHDLLKLFDTPDLEAASHRLVAAINRYNSVMDSARAFVHSVVEPPFDLVFHDTHDFDEDLTSLTSDQVSQLATEINDCCQQLLYDHAAFQRQVHSVSHQVDEETDSSLTAFSASGGFTVLFTVDEDPLFGQVIVTLLRVVKDEHANATTDDLTRDLYKHLSNDAES